MAGAEVLLSKLAGVSQNSDASRIVSRIPILSLRSVDSTTRPSSASSRCSDSQSPFFMGPSPTTHMHNEEEGDGRNLSQNSIASSTSHLDDSGYESPHMKINESFKSQNTNRLSPIATSQTSAFLPRPRSTPPLITATRIPISHSATKIPFKRPNFPRLRSGKELSLSSKLAGIKATVLGDQGQNDNMKGISEENFLRLTKSSGGGGGTSGSPSTPTGVGETQKSTFYSKSLPHIKTLDPPSPSRKMKMRGEVLKMLPPRFTSTPIKAVPSVQFPSIPVRLPSFFTMLGGSESFQAMKSMVDENVKEILEESQKEFGGKYSEWIQQVFNFHLEKIHSRLKQVYTARLEESLQENNKRVLDMKCHYRQKLLEFEEATKKFQVWYDEVLEENGRQMQTNEKLVTALKEQEAKIQMHFKSNLEQKILELEGDFEKEKQQDLNRHAIELQQLQERCNLQQKNLVQQYEHQITSLKKTLENHTNANVNLNKTILFQPKSVPNLSELESESQESLNPQEREEMQTQIQILDTRIKELKHRNNLLTIDHAREITKLQQKLDSNNQNLRSLIKETKESIKNTKTDRERRVREMQGQIQYKEQEHRTNVIQITERYGKKIEELTKSVQLLQNQLLL